MHIRFVHKDQVIGELYNVHHSEVPEKSQTVQIVNPLKANGVAMLIVLDVYSSFEPETSVFDKFNTIQGGPSDAIYLEHWKIVSV